MDYYAYYVLILGIPEDLFWYADIAFVKEVAANKNAYDAWLNSENKRLRERAQSRAKHGR